MKGKNTRILWYNGKYTYSNDNLLDTKRKIVYLRNIKATKYIACDWTRAITTKFRSLMVTLTIPLKNERRRINERKKSRCIKRCGCS